MKNNKINYIVTGFLYRNHLHFEHDNIYIEEHFSGNTTLEARKKAFSYFESLLDVLLSTKGLEYQNDKQAQKELKIFYDSDYLNDIHKGKDDDKFISIGFYTSGQSIWNNKKVRIFGKDHHVFKQEINQNLKEEQKFLM